MSEKQELIDALNQVTPMEEILFTIILIVIIICYTVYKTWHRK